MGQAFKGTSQLVGLLVLSRIVEPAVFGIAAIASLIVGLGELLRDAGLTTAALREPDLDHAERSGLFWMNLLLGIGVGLTLIVAAPLVVTFLGLQIPTLALQALATVFVFGGWSAQYRADLLRNMRFGPVALADGASAFAGLVVATFLARNGLGFWALIAQMITVAFTSASIVWILGRWRPGPVWTLPYARRFVRFGLGVTISQSLGYVGNNVDATALAASQPISALGIYNRAFQLVMAPMTMIQLPLQNSLVPALSRMRNDRPATCRLIERAQIAVGICVLPIPALIAATAPGLVPAVLGPGWEPAVAITWWLAGAAALQSLASIASWILISEGRASRLVAYSAVSLLVRAAILIPLAHIGPNAVAAGYFLSTLLLWPFAIVWACAGARVRVPVFATLVRSAKLFAIYMVVAIVGYRLSVAASNPILAIGYGGTLAVVVYMSTLFSRHVRVVVKSVIGGNA